MKQSLTSPLNAAVQKAGAKLSGLLMTEIRGAGDKDDAANLNDDLAVISRIVDELILEIGQYAEMHLGAVDMDLFKDQLSGALEGNAMFEIEEAGKQASEYLEAAE